MVRAENDLSDREFNYILDRIRWLEQEITRYRDFEWKATSFNSAVFIALLYILLDEQKKEFIFVYKFEVTIVVILYLLFSLFNIFYIHKQLNIRRNKKNELLEYIDPIDPKPKHRGKITLFWGLVEGYGVIFPIGFMFSLVFLACAVLKIIWFTK